MFGMQPVTKPGILQATRNTIMYMQRHGQAHFELDESATNLWSLRNADCLHKGILMGSQHTPLR